MTPLEFVQKLAALIPRSRLNLTRYHGVLMPYAPELFTLTYMLMLVRPEKLINHIPMQRIGTAEEVAKTVLWLMSPAVDSRSLRLLIRERNLGRRLSPWHLSLTSSPKKIQIRYQTLKPKVSENYT